MARWKRVARFAVLGVVGASLATVSSAAVARGASGQADVRAAATGKRVVSARTTSALSMPAPGFVRVQSVSVSAGAWTVIAKATAVNTGASDFVRCQLYDATNKVALDGATYQVGGTISNGGPITNLATITVATGATVRVQQRCGHDGSAGDAAYLDADASLVALQTRDNAADDQTIARTTATTPMTSTNTTVLSFTLPTGDYAIGIKMTGVTFSGNSTVTCLFENPRGVTGGPSVTVGGAATSAATNAYFTYLSGGGSVSLVCSAFGPAGAYLDPDVVLWARNAKAAIAVENGCGPTLVNATTDLVAVVRDGPACPIQGTATAMSGAFINAGSWVAVGGEAALDNLAGSDFARCALSENVTTHLDGTAVWEPQFTYVGTTQLAALKTTGPTRVSETCGRDTSGASSVSYDGSLVLIRV
jgi:hypothetical protein